MKYIRIVLIFFISISLCSFYSHEVFAGCSGACSGHGGVACGEGPDDDGSVICNDGFKNSSAQYDDCVKCKIDPQDNSTKNSSNSNNNGGRDKDSNKSKSSSNNLEKDRKNSFLDYIWFVIVPLSFILLFLDKYKEDRKNHQKKATDNNKSIDNNKTANNSNVGQIKVYQICPKCGNKMVIRYGKYGKFYGCSRYPHCKGTRSI